MNFSTRKQIAALRVAVEALELKRQGYSVGHAAYLSGIRADVAANGIEWTGFAFAEEHYNEYVKIEATIRELEDLIEVLEDPGGTVVMQPSLFQEMES